MKANELMIDDWVLKDMYDSEEDQMYKRPDYQPYQIQNGEDIDLACETNCIGDADVYLPIHLTPKILEKNGFYWGYPVDIEDMASNVFGGIGIAIEMPHKSWVWDEGDGVVSLIFPNECDGGQITVTYNDRYINLVFSDTVNVHELQHALRLCGIKKEIVI